jgi:hypothetical protein
MKVPLDEELRLHEHLLGDATRNPLPSCAYRIGV